MSSLVAISLLTNGVLVSIDQGYAGDSSLIRYNGQPEPGKPFIGSDPSIYWSSSSSLDDLTSYSCIEIADIDIDGDLDIIAGLALGGLQIWANDGDGAWYSFSSPGLATIVSGIAIGDIDDDGEPDITISASDALYAWTGDTLGNWIAYDTGLPSGEFNSIALDDIDLDGDLDIVSGCSALPGEKGVQVLLNNGGGNWIGGDTGIPLGFTSYGIVTGDFNIDGQPDIVSAQASGLSAWVGDGAGSWTLRDIGLPGFGQYSDIALSDMDIDGDLDIVATNGASGGLTVWNGDGWGSWTMTFNLPFIGTYNSVEVVDANLDGYPDIITAPSNTNDSVWSGGGSDDWYLQTYGLPAGLTLLDMAIADIDDDGRLEMVGVDGTSGLNIWSGEVRRVVNAWSSFNPPATASTIMDIDTADVNLDGKMDIILATENQGIEVWTGDGNGVWQSYSTPAMNGRYRHISSEDFNNDGIPDIVATSAPGVKAWVGNGAGGWTYRSSGLPSSGTYDGLTIADFNDDGNLDIAAGSRGNSGVAVWNGDGWGSWTMTFDLPSTGSYMSLEHADVNHDGDLDLITMNGTLKVFLGDGQDGWVESTTGLSTATGNYNSIAIGDLNADGNPDILSTEAEPEGLKIWEGLGDGTWAQDTSSNSGDAKGLAVGDFNLDGSQDIIFTSNSTPTGIHPLMQLDPGWLPVSTGLTSGSMYSAIQLLDINIDGKPDILSIGATGDGLEIWVGTYQQQPILPPYAADTSLSGAGNEDVMLNWSISPTDYDVESYHVYRSSSFDNTGSGYNLIHTLGHGMSGYVDNGVGNGDSNNYFYIIGAQDSNGNFVNTTIQAGKISTPVNNGWNLISSPVIQKGSSIGNTYGNINWNHALYYDSQSLDNKWLGNATTRPDILDNLDYIGSDMGVWLNVNGNDDLITTGLVENVTIELKAGWNLVGYPCLETKTVSDIKIETGATSIEGFDPVGAYLTKVMLDTDTMSIDNGYWIKVDSDTTWTINNY